MNIMSEKSNILIVDDIEENLLAMEQILMEEGLGMPIEVFTVNNGSDALRLTLHHNFALILLDVQMPGMDGFELAELLRVKKKTKQIPIIFLSAVFSSEYYIMKGFESGAVDFLSKHINTKILFNKIKNFVQLDQHKINLEQQRKIIENKNKSLEQVNEQLCEQQHILHENMESLRVLAKVFESCEGIMITDADAKVIQVNNTFEEITGYNSDEIIGTKAQILDAEQNNSTFNSQMWEQLLDEGSWSGEVWDKHKDGHSYLRQVFITAVKDAEGVTTEYVCTFSDITERYQAQKDIHQLAFYDPLTNLPNRRLLMDRLDLVLSSSMRSKKHTAVLFIDMDKFKLLNDTLGHDFGDLMLIEVAQRIDSCIRKEDTVSRLGGDEFVILLTNLSHKLNDATYQAAIISEKIRLCLSEAFKLKDHEHFSSASIGISMRCGNEISASEVLKQADLAMYQAKEFGRNCVYFFDPVMQLKIEHSAALDVDLRNAIINKQLHLYYQIQVDDNQQPIGAEALIRWIHPSRDFVSPAEFVPYAESNSLILNIGDWVIETACQQLQLWSKSEQMKGITLAINVSAKQFKQYGFVEKITNSLQRYHIEPSLLKLEITESIVLEDIDKMVTKMEKLQALGICFSLDDFGTGYSSLSYLKQLPIDQIKIDQSFIRNMTSDIHDEMLVKTIIEMAKNFKIDVIAEGVETKDQLSLLQQLGCIAFQGFYFSKPVPAEQFKLLFETPPLTIKPLKLISAL
jgi:diguanylate cyclase (GGDEF)-like protein/PAS domain S-box-containing protein